MSHRFEVLDGDPADSLNERASSTDLVVMAAHDDRDRTARGLCGRVITGAGVPVVLLPAIGARPDIGNTVPVAWNDSREAAPPSGGARPGWYSGRAARHQTTTNDHICDAARFAPRAARHPAL